MRVPANISQAPYQASLAKEPGWCDVIPALEEMLDERGILQSDVDRTMFIRCEFVDGRAGSIGIYGDPSVQVRNHPTVYNSDIYEVLEEFLTPTLSENPMHFALFRYEKGIWAAAKVFDSEKETWNQWRASRAQCKADRLAWFEKLAKNQFEVIHEINLYIMIDQRTTEQVIVPLLIGMEKKTVWMMTSFFSDKLNPRSGNQWSELPTCDSELVYRCSKAQLGEAVNSVKSFTDSLEVAAIKQVAEAFYWRFTDGLKDKAASPNVDFSEPQRFQVLPERTHAAQALEPDSPFLLTKLKDKPELALADGRKICPALVTIEGALSRRLSPGISSLVQSATGGLGKAPKTFSGPNEEGLFSLLRDEIVKHGSIKSEFLKKRMECFAGAEFHLGRFLPDDLVPHLDYMYLVNFGTGSLFHHLRQVEEYVEFKSRYANFRAQLDEDPFYERPSLALLNVYKGLKKLDLRDSTVDDLEWLESVDWLEEILLSGSTVKNFAPLATVKGLKNLDLTQTDIESLNVLRSLEKLQTLVLNSVQIEDISLLSSIKSLKKISLSNMPIRDISCLESLVDLEEVFLAGIDDIHDYSVLSLLPKLKMLSIAQTQTADLSILPDMPNLETLYLWDCIHVNDLSPLERYPKLKLVNSRGTGVVQ